MFLMHGSIYLHLKTTGKLRDRIDRWMWCSYGLFVAMYLVVTIATWFVVPRATAPFANNRCAWLVVVINVVAVLSIPYALSRHWSGRAFFASCLTVSALVLLLGLALFPNLVTSTPNPDNSLTIYSAASSPEDARHHADRGHHGDAVRVGLHGNYLLGLSRPSGHGWRRVLVPLSSQSLGVGWPGARSAAEH